MTQDGISRFFAFARERHAIHLRRRAGKPWPWTDDPILQRHRFTNVFRELDATTAWFREHVREPLRSSPDVLLATVLFRWFNRIQTGEAIFSQVCSLSEHGAGTPWELWQRHRWEDTEEFYGVLYDAIRSYCRTPTGHGYRQGPYVTGAYIIKTPDGYDKLQGVLQCVQWFMEKSFSGTCGVLSDLTPFDWRWLADTLKMDPGYTTLESVWSWLRQFPYLGDFMAYEIVTDLRHTDLLCRAPDIMTWANPGPGATRGLGRVYWDKPETYRQSQKLLLNEMMQDLLACSRRTEYWPQFDGSVYMYCSADMDGQFHRHRDWPTWEMRDVEHTLCEYDKFCRVLEGGGAKRRYEYHA